MLLIRDNNLGEILCYIKTVRLIRYWVIAFSVSHLVLKAKRGLLNHWGFLNYIVGRLCLKNNSYERLFLWDYGMRHALRTPGR